MLRTFHRPKAIAATAIAPTAALAAVRIGSGALASGFGLRSGALAGFVTATL